MPKDVPKVSVVIPAYNSAGMIGRTMESVLEQTYNGWDLVVLDDGSSDGTAEVAASYAQRDPRIRVVRGQNGGVAAARNHGFSETDERSEFITFLDHDDIWEIDALETLVALSDIQPECVGAHGIARSINEDGERPDGDNLEEVLRKRPVLRNGRTEILPLDAPTTFASICTKNCLVTPSTGIYRRAAFASIGGFEPATVPSDDWDMAIRITRLGDLAFTDHTVLNWRRMPTNQSEISSRWRQSHLLVRCRAIVAPENTPDQRQTAKRAMLAECRVIRKQFREDLARRNVAPASKKLARIALLYAAYMRAVIRVMPA